MTVDSWEELTTLANLKHTLEFSFDTMNPAGPEMVNLMHY